MVLNLAVIAKPADNIKINKLILLACPVQTETAHFTNHKMFKKIISCYSHADFIQTLDPQKVNIFKDMIRKAIEKKSIEPIKDGFAHIKKTPFFSERHFDPSPGLIQAEIKWGDLEPDYEHELHMLSDHAKIIKPLLGYLAKPNRGLRHIEFMLPPFIKKLPDVLHKVEQESQQNPKNQDAADIVLEL